jgi:hypothetical protein
MRPHRVVAHDEDMYTNHEFTKALVVDHQQRLGESARLHRLAVLARRARREPVDPTTGRGASKVHYLPTRVVQIEHGETRAAS